MWLTRHLARLRAAGGRGGFPEAAPRLAVLPAVVALLCLAPAAPTPLSAQSRSLKLVSTAWSPFTNGPGQPRFALDLVEAALGRNHITSTTTIVSPAEFTGKLISGDFDGSGAAWRDATRERMLLFSQPYLENRLVIVGRHGADVSASSLAALKGRRIAIVEGYSYGEAIGGSGPAWVQVATSEDSLTAVLKGTADYALMDELVVTYLVSNYPKESESRLQIGKTALLTRPLYLAISRTRPDAEGIVNGFNAQIRNMIKDRTYHRLLHVQWITADVNGDGIPDYVPADDRPGPNAPTDAYSLFTMPAGPPAQKGKVDYYIGGNIYETWLAVPDAYKKTAPNHPDPRQSTASLFKFVW
jgi:ABC-type amino acid transport substrate-binding protein